MNGPLTTPQKIALAAAAASVVVGIGLCPATVIGGILFLLLGLLYALLLWQGMPWHADAATTLHYVSGLADGVVKPGAVPSPSSPTRHPGPPHPPQSMPPRPTPPPSAPMPSEAETRFMKPPE
ncbi:MAG: hypothetical protein QM774_12320 [Gordonia sp. (in: high G+C Gram-positive bacteria)]|uniref:hypothetical protein n=1 Tax=Gordonia sp. (in: high G+C Gram-positive bacteria) TaxID=84139 RepID=UPI0039E60A71